MVYFILFMVFIYDLFWWWKLLLLLLFIYLFYFIKSLNGINFSSAEVGIPTGKRYSHFIQML